MIDTLSTMWLPLITCLALTLILGYPGLHVIKREVIFIDIAVAQIAALGAISAHMFLHVHADSPTAAACAFGSTLAAALFFATVKHKVITLPIEATIGITYALSAAAALFIIGKHTGHTHIQQMLTGSLLWVTARDVKWSMIVFAVAGAGFMIFHRRFRSISDNYQNQKIEGINLIAWDFLFYALCGIVITAAVRLAGVIVVFSFLIIPALISAIIASKWKTRLIITWGTGAIGSVTGLIFCQTFDFSAGVSVGLFLGILLITGSLIKYALTKPGKKQTSPPLNPQP
jgi:zinc/manganese transport system permease protein